MSQFSSEYLVFFLYQFNIWTKVSKNNHVDIQVKGVTSSGQVNLNKI